MDLLIKNGTVVTATGEFKSDIGIQGEKIVQIAPRIEEKADKVIDAAGKYIFPGLIDVHTHFQLPVGNGYTSADTFLTGSRAAARGGITTFIDFVHQNRGQAFSEAMELRLKEAKDAACIDYSFHLAPSDMTPDTRETLVRLVEEGFCSFKVYLAYRHLMLQDEEIARLLELAARANAITGFHAEDFPAIEARIAELGGEGKLDFSFHSQSRPDVTEARGIEKALALGEASEAKMYFFHVSTLSGLEKILEAKKKRRYVMGETTPNYLLLNESKYLEQDGYLYVLTPPLRNTEDSRQLWYALMENALQIVATDHCPFLKAEKAAHKDDFRLIPNGLPGVETTLMLLFSEGFRKGKLLLRQIAALTSLHPALIFGLYPQKGTIREGADADLVIFDPNRNLILNPENLLGEADYSQFQGLEVKGSPLMTISRGEVICVDGECHVSPGRGKLVKRELKFS